MLAVASPEGQPWLLFPFSRDLLSSPPPLLSRAALWETRLSILHATFRADTWVAAPRAALSPFPNRRNDLA